MANTIVGKELGFESGTDYVKCHGWTFSVKGGVITVEYQKLAEAIAAASPNQQSANLNTNFMAMIEKVYKSMEEEIVKDIYPNLPYC